MVRRRPRRKVPLPPPPLFGLRSLSRLLPGCPVAPRPSHSIFPSYQLGTWIPHDIRDYPRERERGGGYRKSGCCSPSRALVSRIISRACSRDLPSLPPSTFIRSSSSAPLRSPIPQRLPGVRSLLSLVLACRSRCRAT